MSFPSELHSYLALGLRLHPLKSGDKTPALKGWADLASKEVSEIERFYQLNNSANWGAVAGKESDLVVIDIDPRNGGDVTWNALCAKYGEPNAPKVSTPSGGTHYYFRYTAGGESPGKGVDVLTNRRNVVLPPSTVGGVQYSWVAGEPPAYIPDMPKWLKQILKKAPGSRNDDAYKRACAMFRAGKDNEEVLECILAEFGDEDDPAHNASLRKAVDSAQAHASSGRTVFSKIPDADTEDYENFLPSDHGNAMLFQKYAPSDMLFVQDVGWALYDGTVWEIDDGAAARAFTRIMERQREVYVQAAISAPDMDTRKEMIARVNHFTLATNNKNVKNGLESASRLEGVLAELQKFDAENSAYLLNFRNGTVNLKTGTLHPHKKEDYITKIVDANYAPGAEAPFWQATVQKMFGGDQELIEYVQTMLGASMIGSQDTRTLFIAYGPTGKNGKSTLFETLAEILGSYSDHAELRTLAGSDTNNLTELTTRMRIRGARLVVSSEVASTDSMDASTIKRLTGGDTISARSMFKNTVTFRPICSIWLRTNSLPMVRGADKAFWERICVIPFDYRFEGDEQLDFAEVNRRFKAEAPGILAWLVEGAQRWSNRTAPVKVPERVQALRNMYMQDTDVFADFTSERLTYSVGAESKLSPIHSAYVEFCKRRGMPAPPLAAFKQDMRRQGLLSPDGRVVLNYIVNQEFSL